MRVRSLFIVVGSSTLILVLSLVACHTGHVRHESTRNSDEAASQPPLADRNGFRRDIRSGTLTAGHFDDATDPDRFSDWADEVSALGEKRGFIAGFDQPAVQLNLFNEHGDPVHNATLVVEDGQRSRVVLQTGTDGRCVFFPGYDRIEGHNLQVRIDLPGRHQPIHRRLSARAGESIDLVVSGTTASLPEKLDLALVIDTTGSMGDELEFLKVEFRAIVERIAERFPHVDQRWAVVVYRDKGDAYVVKDYDFTSSLSRTIDRLGEQRATGGGDYPEAVDQALEAAVDLGWRHDAARIAFLIADAPPHVDRAERTVDMAARMRAAGIALYPVASSGVRAEAEYIFRVSALLTGGSYSFLTDDSGVGNAHSEPHDAPGYTVQRLDDLIVQLVESELIGQPTTPRRRDIIREVPTPGPGSEQLRQINPEQVRAWEQRRDKLSDLLRTTELSPDTAEAVRDEIAMLDRQINDARR